MLSTNASFPFPGSTALLDDVIWRVLRHNGDGTATIYRDGTKASGHRTVDLADLTDPASRIAKREDGRLAVRLALAIKKLDAIRLVEAIDRAQIIRAHYRLPHPITPARIKSILEDLGWTRSAMRPGPIIYLRGGTTMADAGRPAKKAAA